MTGNVTLPVATCATNHPFWVATGPAGGRTVDTVRGVDRVRKESPMSRRIAAAVLFLCLTFLTLAVATSAAGTADPAPPAGHVRASLMSGEFAHRHVI